MKGCPASPHPPSTVTPHAHWPCRRSYPSLASSLSCSHTVHAQFLPGPIHALSRGTLNMSITKDVGLFSTGGGGVISLGFCPNTFILKLKAQTSLAATVKTIALWPTYLPLTPSAWIPPCLMSVLGTKEHPLKHKVLCCFFFFSTDTMTEMAESLLAYSNKPQNKH